MRIPAGRLSEPSRRSSTPRAETHNETHRDVFHSLAQHQREDVPGEARIGAVQNLLQMAARKKYEVRCLILPFSKV